MPAKLVEKPDVEVRKNLSSAWALTRSSLPLLWSHKGLFGGITALYALLSIIFVWGLSAAFQTNNIDALLKSDAGKVAGGLAAYTWLVNTSATGMGPIAGVYQVILLLIFSLAIVWALRHVLADKKSRIKVRDAFYRGMYPLIPVTLVLVVLFAQLVPLLIGLSLFGMVAGSAAVAVRPLEIIIGVVVCAAFIALSLYLFVSYIFAFYIAALPDMTPLRALRSARQLVLGRRLAVIRKLLWIPFVLLLAGLIVMLPVILTITIAAPWIAFIFSVVMLPVVHAYLYTMYREMIG